MKKKAIFVSCIVLTFLLVTALFTSYTDSARVRNSVEPLHTVKIVSDNGHKVTYWGLGYKVIRYTSVSADEPYKDNLGVKYGSWFMKYDCPIGDGLETDDDLKYSTLVIENYVAEIGRGETKLSVELSDEDTDFLADMMRYLAWTDRIINAENDCAINLGGRLIYYDSVSGTLNEYDLSDMSIYSSKEESMIGKSVVLSEEERASVNTILKKYITLLADSNKK